MIFLLIFWNLMAQDVLIQSVDSSAMEYEKQLLENPSFQSYLQHHQQEDRQAEQELLADFKQAQFEFLQGSLQDATSLFEKIGEQKHRTFWSKESQKIIHYSLLRVAQLKSEKAGTFLKEAILFDPEIPVDETIFPPPLVDQYKQIKKSLAINVWNLPRNSENYDLVLINGHIAFKNSKFIKYRNGKVRVDFLSNQFSPVTMVTDIENLESAHLNPQLLAQGTCQNPQFNSLPKQGETFRLFDGNCVSFAGNTMAQPSLESFMPKPSINKDNPSLVQNKWLWIGLGVVATGVAIHLANQQGNQGAESPAQRPQEFTNSH